MTALADTAAETRVTVGTADMAVTDDPRATLITYALGSCVALIVHDPGRLVGGMLHYKLPLAREATLAARGNPAMFADTGIPLLFARICAFDCRREDLVVKAVGGARLCGSAAVFDIGRKNYDYLRNVLAKNGVVITAQDVGGMRSRTTSLDVATGEVLVRTRGRVRTL